MNKAVKEILAQIALILLIMSIFGCGILFGMTMIPPKIIVVEKAVGVLV